MPAPQKIKYILDKSIINKYKSTTNTNSGETFLDFCVYLANFIETNCDGECVAVMELANLPITGLIFS